MGGTREWEGQSGRGNGVGGAREWTQIIPGALHAIQPYPPSPPPTLTHHTPPHPHTYYLEEVKGSQWPEHTEATEHVISKVKFH